MSISIKSIIKAVADNDPISEVMRKAAAEHLVKLIESENKAAEKKAEKQAEKKKADEPEINRIRAYLGVHGKATAMEVATAMGYTKTDGDPNASKATALLKAMGDEVVVSDYKETGKRPCKAYALAVVPTEEAEEVE